MSRCLCFPATGVTWSVWTFQFLPTGLHGLCFGYCFSGPLHLRSLTNGPLFRVRFGESRVVRLYSKIDHLHHSIEAQCVTTLLPLGDCHTFTKWHLPFPGYQVHRFVYGQVFYSDEQEYHGRTEQHLISCSLLGCLYTVYVHGWMSVFYLKRKIQK